MFLAAIDPVLGVLIVGIVGPVLTYLVAARKMTGAVKTSDASELWAESRSIREWSAERIAQLTGTITALETRIKSVEQREDTLLQENNRLTEKVSVLEHRVEVMEARNTTLTTENDALLHKVSELKETIDSLRDEIKTCSNEMQQLRDALAKSENRVDTLEEEADIPESQRRRKEDLQ